MTLYRIYIMKLVFFSRRKTKTDDTTETKFASSYPSEQFMCPFDQIRLSILSDKPRVITYGVIFEMPLPPHLYFLLSKLRPSTDGRLLIKLFYTPNFQQSKF